MLTDDFDKLKKRDFENGAVRDEIRKRLKSCERFHKAMREIIEECPHPTTAYGKRIVEIASRAMAEEE